LNRIFIGSHSLPPPLWIAVSVLQLQASYQQVRQSFQPENLVEDLHHRDSGRWWFLHHMVAYFPLVMGEAPHMWLHNLPKGCINSWDKLCSCSPRTTKRPTAVQAIPITSVGSLCDTKRHLGTTLTLVVNKLVDTQEAVVNQFSRVVLVLFNVDAMFMSS
jgi:hypothetical protein